MNKFIPVTLSDLFDLDGVQELRRLFDLMMAFHHGEAVNATSEPGVIGYLKVTADPDQRIGIKFESRYPLDSFEHCCLNGMANDYTQAAYEALVNRKKAEAAGL